MRASGADLTARLANSAAPPGAPPLSLTLRAYKDGVVRLIVDEPGADRYQVPDVLMPDVEAAAAPWTGAKATKSSWSAAAPGGVSVELQFAPFKLTVSRGGKAAVVVNGRNMFAFEQRRNKTVRARTRGFAVLCARDWCWGRSGCSLSCRRASPSLFCFPLFAYACDPTPPPPPTPTHNTRHKQDADPEGWWAETFLSHADSKPKGPEAISLDAAFPGAAHVYGIPERAARVALAPTTGRGAPAGGSEPYRLYSLDVFEYLDSSPFGLYGSIPFMLAHQPGLTAGAFWCAWLCVCVCAACAMCMCLQGGTTTPPPPTTPTTNHQPRQRNTSMYKQKQQHKKAQRRRDVRRRRGDKARARDAVGRRERRPRPLPDRRARARRRGRGVRAPDGRDGDAADVCDRLPPVPVRALLGACLG